MTGVIFLRCELSGEASPHLPWAVGLPCLWRTPSQQRLPWAKQYLTLLAWHSVWLLLLLPGSDSSPLDAEALHVPINPIAKSR